MACYLPCIISSDHPSVRYPVNICVVIVGLGDVSGTSMCSGSTGDEPVRRGAVVDVAIVAASLSAHEPLSPTYCVFAGEGGCVVKSTLCDPRSCVIMKSFAQTRFRVNVPKQVNERIISVERELSALNSVYPAVRSWDQVRK